jgi:hypothetical protein
MMRRPAVLQLPASPQPLKSGRVVIGRSLPAGGWRMHSRVHSSRLGYLADRRLANVSRGVSRARPLSIGLWASRKARLGAESYNLLR